MIKNFIVAQDGIKVRLDSPCLEGWVDPKSLEDLQTYAQRPLPKDKFPGPKWVGSKMPAELLKKVLGTIHEFPHTETAYVLYYNPTEQKWAVKCPEQYGAGASVSFEDDGKDMPEGYTILGSIHTHPEMGAFWSGTDLNDQKFKAGLHIVFGLHNGLVSQYKCTVFLPSAQEDQDLKDVLEDVDLNQVYDPDPAWVEIIRKQSYRRPVVVAKYYGGHTAVSHSQLPAGHYGTTANAYAGYNNYHYTPSYSCGKYHYGKRKREKWDSWYGSDWYGGWYGSDWYSGDDYDDPIEDRITPDPAESADEMKAAFIACLDSQKDSTKLADVLLDAEVAGKLEQETGIVVTDSYSKEDILLSIEAFMTGETVLTGMTDEEARQIFEGLVDVHPELKLIDPNNALGNDINVGAICDILDGVVEAYSKSKCISPDTLDMLLGTLKQTYESLLDYRAQHDNPEGEVADA